MNAKRIMRGDLRARRDAADRTGEIVVADAFRRRLTTDTIVASYLPIGSEADPAPLVRMAAAAGCPIVLPHVVDRAGPLRFLFWQPGEALETGPFGLRQPASTAPQRDPAIILTPLVGFDRRGNRIGQGAGHYDRAFAAHPAAWRVGIAWSVQEVAAIVPDRWDVPLHAIATEKDWITP